MNTNAENALVFHEPNQRGSDLRHFPLLPGREAKYGAANTGPGYGMFDDSPEGKAEARSLEALRLHVGPVNAQWPKPLDSFTDVEVEDWYARLTAEVRERDEFARAQQREAGDAFRREKPAAVAAVAELQTVLESTLQRLQSFTVLDAGPLRAAVSQLSAQVSSARADLQGLHDAFPPAPESLKEAARLFEVERNKRRHRAAQRKADLAALLAESGIELPS